MWLLKNLALKGEESSIRVLLETMEEMRRKKRVGEEI
jgi:hypothetical protein